MCRTDDHECLRVRFVDDRLQLLDLGAGDHAIEHRPRFAGIRARPVQDGHAALHLRQDAVRHLPALVRDDQRRADGAPTLQGAVHHQAGDVQDDEGIQAPSASRRQIRPPG